MWGRSVRGLRPAARLLSQQTTAPPPQSIPKPKEPEAKGLSSACITPTSAPVGPNVDKDKAGPYKVPEYFQYHTMSYYEAEIEMSNFRLPQPSSIK